MSHSLHTAPAPHAADEQAVRRPWTVLGLMLAAQFMVVLDVSVVNVALPSIGSDLQLQLLRLPVDGQRLRADERRPPAARRPDVRPLRPAPDVPHRGDALHRRLAGQRPRRLRAHPDRRAGRPGRRRRDAHPRGHVDRHDDVRRPPARHRPRRLGHHRQHGHRRRRALRWPAHQRPRLARGVLHQRPDRDRHAARRPARRPPGRLHRHGLPWPRRARGGHPGRRTAAPRQRRPEHQQPRLDLAHDRGQRRRRSGAAGRVRPHRAQGRQSARHPAHLEAPLAGLRLRRHGRRHRRPGGRHLPQLAVPAAGARRLGDRHRPGVPAARGDDHAQRGGRLPPDRPRRPPAC